MQTVCCVCRRHKKNGVWVEAVSVEDPSLSHGYCPTCYKKIMKRFGLSPFLPSSYQEDRLPS